MNSEIMMLLIIVIGIVIGLLVVPAIELQQQAEAAPVGIQGCPHTGPAGNASKVRCIH